MYFLKHILAKICFSSAILFVFLASLDAQNINPSLLTERWKAYWIEVPDEPANDYGVYLFRKSFDMTTKPSSFIVHVSADNRYKLFVNDTMVSLGPARGDLNFWNFETIDLAPFLQPGKNTVAALVWNEGAARPEGQISYHTGFVLQGNSNQEAIINTDTSWKCIRNNAYEPLQQNVPGYYVAGPGEFIDMHAYPKNWTAVNFDDSEWQKAKRFGWRGAAPKGIADATGRMLVPSDLPAMEMKEQRLASVRESGQIQIPANFPAAKSAFSIAANTEATILLDQSFLTNAYPTCIFSKGANASVKIGYAESLYDSLWSGGRMPAKGNRDSTEGKYFIGRKDSIISDGSEKQTFTTLDWRTYRYVQLKIITKDEPLIIEDFYGTFTGYPFKLNSKFIAGIPELQKIFETGWRTARSCAMETYMDCPYYEQLQYIGDARIQALVSLYNSGDDRLVRNALNQMDHSRMAEGITLSRHPSATPQQIATFSLWYIGMLRDYFMYGKDSGFIKDKLPGVRQILWFFSKYQQPDGSLKNVPYWLFTDWVNDKGWQYGQAPVGKDGNSSVLDLQLLWALQLAADMEAKEGMMSYAEKYNQMAEQLKQTIQDKYWDKTKAMFADTPEKNSWSQHANSLAILTETIQGNEANLLAKKISADSTLTQATIYFKYYVNQALAKGGLGNDYLNRLNIWRKNLNMGLTTWAEISDIDHARSDCHAWGASPNIEFFRIVAGIDSEAPAFSKIKVEPHPGRLQNIKAEIPHPNGKIFVNYIKTGEKWNFIIMLPQNTSGHFIWNNKSYSLQPGKNAFTL